MNHPPGGSHHSTLSVPTQGVVLRVLIASASILRKHKETFLYSIICCAKSLSHVQLCDPMDCSPPGSSVHGDLQARILEWVAMSSSRGSSTGDLPDPGIEPVFLLSPALQVDPLPPEPSGKPVCLLS